MDLEELIAPRYWPKQSEEAIADLRRRLARDNATAQRLVEALRERRIVVPQPRQEPVYNDVKV